MLKYILLLVILVGCATGSHYTVKVDSINDGNPKAQSFVIKSIMSDVEENDLQFKEFASILSDALIAAGQKYLGQNTQGQVTVEIDVKDKK